MTEELNCSDGAKMLIERMQTHPQEFKFGSNTKFGRILVTAREVMRGEPRDMSKRDAEALVKAAEAYLFEAWLAEDVITQLMPPERKQVNVTPRGISKSVLTTGQLQEQALAALEAQYNKAKEECDFRAQQRIEEAARALNGAPRVDTLRYNTKNRYTY
jgi:hypothetical protein